MIKNISAWAVSFFIMMGISVAVFVVSELKLFIPEDYSAPMAILCILFCWVLYLQLPDSFQKWSQRIWKVCLQITVLVTICYLIVKFNNPYQWGQYPRVQYFCEQNPSMCSTTVKVFFAIKMYRLITLSPPFLLYFVYVFGGLVLLDVQRARVAAFQKHFRKEKMMYLLAGGVLFLGLYNSTLVTNIGLNLLVKAWENRQLSFLDRFVPYEYGIQHHGWIWEYGKFVRKHVPENQIIFIPPQNDIWPQEGNMYYFRWFTYPRMLTQSTDAWAEIPLEAHFIVISRGGWHGNEAGWPKRSPIPECIKNVYLKDRVTLEESEVPVTQLETALKVDSWGLIELQRPEGIRCRY